MRKKGRPSDGQVVSSTHQAKQKWLQVKSRLYLNVLLLQGSNYCCYCPTHRSPLLPRALLLPRAQLPHTLLPRTPPPPLRWPTRRRRHHHCWPLRRCCCHAPPPPLLLLLPSPLVTHRVSRSSTIHRRLSSSVDHPLSTVIGQSSSSIVCPSRRGAADACL